MERCQIWQISNQAIHFLEFLKISEQSLFQCEIYSKRKIIYGISNRE